MKTAQVLVIGYVWPEPNSSAAGGRMMQLVQLFKKQGWEVTFACPASESEHMSDLASIGIQKAKIELNNESFDRFVAALNPTIVLFDRFMMEEQFGWRVAEHCPDAIRMIDTVDLHFLRNARQVALKEGRKMTQADLQSDMAKREIASILRSDLSLIISQYEMELLKETFRINVDLLYYLPLLVPSITETDMHTWLPFEERKDFVFIGNFLHEPNWNAVQYLKETIWPLIRKHLPKAELHVYGAYPPQKAMQMHKPAQGFYVEGRAEDAQAVVAKAKICLAPLRFGAGVKGKLAEAMQCGTPSVTTDIGAEGMSGNLPWNGAIANTPEEIALSAVHLYTDVVAWKQAQQNGIKIINTRNAESLHTEVLIDTIEASILDLNNRRSNNFIGSLLLHHTMTSTKYMSRWIEAKNK